MSTNDKTISRRKFMATSLAVAAGAAALGSIPLEAHAQDTGSSGDADQLLASLDQIAPSGIIQNKLSGKAANLLASIPIKLKHAEYSVLAGGKSSGLTIHQDTYTNPKSYQAVSDLVSRRIRGMGEEGLRYTDYTLKTQLEGVWAEQDSATVIWTEQVVLKLAGDRDPAAPQESLETITHLTSLRRKGAAWRIEHDDSDFRYKPVSILKNETNEIGIKVPTSTKRTLQIKQADLFNQIQQEDHANSLAAATATYSRERASQYALDHGGDKDESGWHDYGANCTSFISRCLAAGGWPSKTGLYWTNDGWYYSNNWPYGARPWYNAESWYWFTNNTQRATRTVGSVWNLWFGDILQYDEDKDPNRTMNHSAIVSFRSYSGIIYMAQHTTNYNKKPLSDIVAAYPNYGYYAWRMKTSF